MAIGEASKKFGLLERVPSTKDFASSMFMEMLNKIHQNDNLILEYLQKRHDGKVTEEQILDYIDNKIFGFFFGKDPDWWIVSL